MECHISKTSGVFLGRPSPGISSGYSDHLWLVHPNSRFEIWVSQKNGVYHWYILVYHTSNPLLYCPLNSPFWGICLIFRRSDFTSPCQWTTWNTLVGCGILCSTWKQFTRTHRNNSCEPPLHQLESSANCLVVSTCFNYYSPSPKTGWHSESIHVFLRLKSAGCAAEIPNCFVCLKIRGTFVAEPFIIRQQDSGAYSWSMAYEPNNIGNGNKRKTGDSEKKSATLFQIPTFGGRNLHSLFWAWSSQFQSWIVMALPQPPNISQLIVTMVPISKPSPILPVPSG